MEIQAGKTATIEDNRKLYSKESFHSPEKFKRMMQKEKKEPRSELKSPFDTIFAASHGSTDDEISSEDEKKAHKEPSAAPYSGQPPFSHIASNEPAQGIAAVAISPQVAELFEQIASQLTYVDQNGIQETTIELSDPHYSHSPFYGATITIREYSTAPKAFNVYLTASAEAVALFQTHASALVEAFPNGKGMFSIHRCETTVMKTKKLIEAVENLDEHNEQGNGRE